MCGQLIMTDKFYAFPCKHAFHRRCIVRKLKGYETANTAIKDTLQKVLKLAGQVDGINDRYRQ